MTFQDYSKIGHSCAIPTGSNGIELNTGGQIKSEEGYVPKIRKPYTISKQRERWTEDEHKRFLEALKQHGRAWRRIEEHVGTKTAVQIRSHAQKFFSKVVRESSDSNSVEPVKIPPPRPKRKPAHPYPRKLVLPAKRRFPLQEQSAKSASLHSSLDQENRSPTSVLSGSDTLGSADSHMLDVSTPVSNCEDAKPATDMASGDDQSGQENASELDDEHVLMKLELVIQHEAFGKEGSVEANASTKNLRLFGKILSVVDPEKPSTSSPYSSNPKSQDSSEGLASEDTDSAGANADIPPAVWYMNASSHPHPMEVDPSAPLPRLAFYRAALPFVPLDIVDVAKAESHHQCLAEPAMDPKYLDPSSISNSSEKCKQGFLPYKGNSSKIETQPPTADEVQRLHLFL